MQLGKSLLGGIIGAAVGIGLLLAVHRLSGLDKVWLAVPFALITGLGVRMLVSTSGHASYVRGALTMALALAGYIGGWYLVAQVATARANAPLPIPRAAAEGQPAAEPGEPEAKVEAAPAEQPKAAAIADDGQGAAKMRPLAPKVFGSNWDMIWLAVAALVAYEMGRGSATSTAQANQSAEPAPGGTHPDA